MRSTAAETSILALQRDLPKEVDVTARLRDAVQALLRELGPLDPAEVIRQLRLREWFDGELSDDELSTLLFDDEPGEFTVFPLVDGRWCDLDHLLEGLVLTHVVRDDERAGNLLRLEPDLEALLLVEVDGTRTVPLTSG